MPLTRSVPRVLVVGVIPPLTWAVTRCLVRAGARPVVLGWHWMSPLALLRECTYVPMPPVAWRGDELDPVLIKTLEEQCRRWSIDVVVPADYESSLLLSGTDALACGARLCAVPNRALLHALHDKWQFSQLLARLGLPHPRSERVVGEHALTRTDLRFPIITKPTNRSAGVGFQLHRSPRELGRTLAQGRLATEFPLLAQEYARGLDVGFGFLAKAGRVVAYTSFERTLAGRRHFDAPRLRSHVERLLLQIGYHGVGEVDARYDPVDDTYQLLELNPRFWASLLHAANGGLNFPELLLRLDSLGEGPPCTARPGIARLQPYEFMIRKAAQLSQLMHGAGYRPQQV
jgi:hypothetical protein